MCPFWWVDCRVLCRDNTTCNYFTHYNYATGIETVLICELYETCDKPGDAYRYSTWGPAWCPATTTTTTTTSTTTLTTTAFITQTSTMEWTSTPSTGGTSNTLIWILSVLFLVLVIVGFIFYRRYKRNRADRQSFQYPARQTSQHQSDNQSGQLSPQVARPTVMSYWSAEDNPPTPSAPTRDTNFDTINPPTYEEYLEMK